VNIRLLVFQSPCPTARLAVVASLLACSASSFAQSACGPVTRADVRTDLIRLEQAGYRPAGDDPYYPEDIQAAEAKVAREEARRAEAQRAGVAAGVTFRGMPGGANCPAD
jgi:hypothetical protein